MPDHPDEPNAADPSTVGEHLDALMRVAIARRDEGRLGEAIDLLAEAADLAVRIDRVPTYVLAMTALGDAHTAEERFADAVTCYAAGYRVVRDVVDWPEMEGTLSWRLAGAEAAVRAGIPVPEDLVRAAAPTSGQRWVSECDEDLVEDDHIPAHAVRRFWEVRDGLVTGTTVANPRYRRG
ncbi:tetratricopeptide repeat protein [Saccharothrix sp. HUAS TT1]|uniref:tetratricopeptide repeat protein n=1 Tax=unclassified Saccharothrix TaxID=2593673 RepID=UPI00345B8DFD